MPALITAERWNVVSQSSAVALVASSLELDRSFSVKRVASARTTSTHGGAVGVAEGAPRCQRSTSRPGPSVAWGIGQGRSGVDGGATGVVAATESAGSMTTGVGSRRLHAHSPGAASAATIVQTARRVIRR